MKYHQAIKIPDHEIDELAYRVIWLGETLPRETVERLLSHATYLSEVANELEIVTVERDELYKQLGSCE